MGVKNYKWINFKSLEWFIFTNAFGYSNKLRPNSYDMNKTYGKNFVAVCKNYCRKSNDYRQNKLWMK